MWEYSNCLLTDGSVRVILSEPEYREFMKRVREYNAENADNISLSRAIQLFA